MHGEFKLPFFSEPFCLFYLAPVLPLANNSILLSHNPCYQNYYVSFYNFLHIRSIINTHAYKFFFEITAYKNGIIFWKLFSAFCVFFFIQYCLREILPPSCCSSNPFKNKQTKLLHSISKYSYLIV